MSRIRVMLACWLLALWSSLAFSDVEGEGEIAVSNWNIVPSQKIAEPLNVGVLAFHYNGISHVDFSVNSGSWIRVNNMKLNRDTGVYDYYIEIDPQDYKEEFITVESIAYPKNGKLKVNELIRLYLNKQAEKKLDTVYVSNFGDDNNEGTYLNPYKKISHAIKKVNAGGSVIIISPGVYHLDGSGDKMQNKKWVTVKAKEALNRDDVVLSMPNRGLVRLKINMLKFENLSLDFGDIQQIYPENGQMLWFHKVRWFDKNGASYQYKKNVPPVRTSRYIHGYYVTDSIAENMTYGFVDALLARNVVVRKISADAFQNARMVVGAEVYNIDGRTKKELHSDVFQYYGHYDNLIVYSVKGHNLRHVQNFFFDHVTSSFSNSAFINVCINNKEGNPPFSQLASLHKNIFFKNVITENQGWRFRDDLPGPKKFVANSVIFEDSVFESIKRGLHNKNHLPAGVKFFKVRKEWRYTNADNSACK